MTRRLKRKREYEITLEIKDDMFIRPPRDAQRNWLLNRTLGEFAADLEHLDRLAERFVRGSDAVPPQDRAQTDLADDEIMEDWQLPLMSAMAEVVTSTHGDVLEVGFGRGVSAEHIQRRGVRSHTIIECNDHVVRRFDAWRQRHPVADIRLAHGLWQDQLPALGEFDGIFFHTYPLNEAEFLEHLGSEITYAEHFIADGAAHLRPGGVLTYLSNEIDSLSRSHQRLLFEHFERVTTQMVGPLSMPEDVKDAWWADSMIVLAAVKGHAHDR